MFVAASPVLAGGLIMKDGRELKGLVGNAARMTETAENPAPEHAPRPIYYVDNQLYRIFVPKAQVQSVSNAPPAGLEVIPLKQQVANYGSKIGSLGPIERMEPFNQFGQRRVTMRAHVAGGKIDVIQGITVLTPHWAKIQSLQRTSGPNYLWDLRIATSSIPRETLTRLLNHQIDPKNPEQRLKVVRLYLGAERYADAERELAAMIAAFPDLKNLNDELRSIRQLGARRNLQELELRQKAGQHELVAALLDKFPTQDVAGAILQQIKSMQEDCKARRAQVVAVRQAIDRFALASMNLSVKKQLAPALQEIARELNLNTLDRLADFRRLAGSDDITPDNKLALAVTGWIFGSGNAVDSVTLAASCYQTRQSIVAYLREPLALRRGVLLDALKSEEAATPRLVAQIVAHMRPPLEDRPPERPLDIEAPAEPPAEPAPPAPGQPPAPPRPPGSPPPGSPPPGPQRPHNGFYTLTTAAAKGSPDLVYHVQLPPEYDSLRRYPCVVSLNGGGNTPVQQVDWWCGTPNAAGHRLGHAGRYGYIVIVPEWIKKGQTEYQYSYREHAAALSALRDACRRFAIDTDRVFLSGHSMGGDAVWDIALSHPDLWAGVIPIVAQADKFVGRYAANAPYVPFYFLGGELDGDKTVRNGKEIDRYMEGSRHDVSVVEYQGRGHEDFIEDILNLFDWMNRRERNFARRDFAVATLRATDNFFWWTEIDDMSPDNIASPTQWPPKANIKPMTTTGKIITNRTGPQSVTVQTAARRVTVWLGPELVDFQRPIQVEVARRPKIPAPPPNLETLLEDTRTRGDRQHPFWTKVELESGARPTTKP